MISKKIWSGNNVLGFIDYKKKKEILIDVNFINKNIWIKGWKGLVKFYFHITLLKLY